MDFTGKVALITGGGGGIGRATALGFALRGAKVMVVDHDAESGKVTTDVVAQRGGDAKFVMADVTKSASVQDYVKATLDAYGRIDCFFNNAGIEGKVVPIQDYDEAVFTIVPDCWRNITGSTWRRPRKTPFRLTPITASNMASS